MRTPLLILCGLAALALTISGCGSGETKTASYSVDVPSSSATTDTADTADEDQAKPAKSAKKPKVTVPDSPAKKLETEDIKKGTGATAKKGDAISVNYVGVGQKTKKEFDNSYDRGEPFDFALGGGEVIPGWDEGIVGMKVGGRRKLIIPGDKAYGPTGRPPSIKPNETLVFIVDLVEIQ
jgi:peptidylprolyl isomerase